LQRGDRMSESHNRVVRVKQFGGPEQLEIVDAPLPTPRIGEVRVRVLASSLEYTDVTIRRHLYAQTIARRPPFVLGYDLVGEIDEIGPGVPEYRIGDRVADLTVTGSNASYRTLRAEDLVRVPAGVDPAEASAVILSWTTAYQLLHRTACVRPGQRALVQGAAGAVGQALVVLGKMAGLELWGTARAHHAPLLRELGATPIDYQHEQPPAGFFDVVFDGIGQDDFRGSYAALAPGGLLCAYGYTATVGPEQRLGAMLAGLTRVYLSHQLKTWIAGAGPRTSIYSINLMRALHPQWFKEDLGKLFDMLASGAIHPRVAERISFEQVIDAHRRVEAGGLEGKLVLCPN